MLVLGIETSCDETGLALYCSKHGLIGNVLHSQTAIHQAHGGVVPELASRNHIEHLIPLLNQLLQKTNCQKEQISAIAYTQGPGLIGALLVGATFAKSLALALDIPCLGIHHLEGHLLAPLLENPAPNYPFLALLVSGGHTALFTVTALGQYQCLGETLDDAAGEAFDKVAKLLGLPYPGGPLLATLAEQGDINNSLPQFPRPMVNRPGLDFSFSGLKTFVRNFLATQSTVTEETKANIALNFQTAVVDTLRIKCERALKQTNLHQLVIAGGVGANLALRQALKKLTTKLQCQLFYPRVEFCTDNGAMIALAGWLRLRQQQCDSDYKIEVLPRWPLEELN